MLGRDTTPGHLGVLSLTFLVTALLMHPGISAAEVIIDARTAIDYVNKIRGEPCEEGTGQTLQLKFDHREWTRYADLPINTANLLTKLLIAGDGHLLSVDEPFLYSLCRNNIQRHELVFGSAIAFEPGVFGNYSRFAPYAHRTSSGTSKEFDVALYYDYMRDTVEWYTTLRERNWTNLRILNHTVIYGYGEAETSKEPSVGLNDGRWSNPFFDCGGGDIWMVTYSAPFFHLRVGDGTPAFRGIATVDIDLTNIDINQCDVDRVADNKKETYLDVFRGTHRCQPTTKCRAVHGLGFRRGAYECICKDGYFFSGTSETSKAFNGSHIEAYFDQGNITSRFGLDVFRCILCARGCSVCQDSSPCMFPYNTVARVVIVVIAASAMLAMVYLSTLVYRSRSQRVVKSASPVFLQLMCFGGVMMNIQLFLVYDEPSDAVCIVKSWLAHLGFYFLYGALLLKTYRISTIFARTRKRVFLPDKVLLRYMIPVLLFAVTYLLVWTVLSAPHIVVITTRVGLKYIRCDGALWEYAASGVECLFLLWGVYLSYAVRKAPSQFNESRFITWSIYNAVLLGTFLIIITEFIAVPIGPDVYFAMLFVDLQVRVTITLMLIFVPKIHTLRVYPDGDPTQGDEDGVSRIPRVSSVTGLGVPVPQHARAFTDGYRGNISTCA